MNDVQARSLEIATLSGNVVVRVADVDRPKVVKGKATIDADGVVHGAGSGNVELCCPPGTEVIVASKSGSVSCEGPLGRVVASTSSGKVHIDSAESVDVRTASGRVEVGACAGSCRVVTISANVEVGTSTEADVSSKSGRITVGPVRDASLRSASGTVVVESAGGGAIDARTMSGSVEVRVPRTAVPTVTARSLSGRIRQPRDVSADEGTVSVETMSGSISVDVQ